MSQRLRTDRHGGILPFNPATAVRGPKHVVKRGKTPVLAPEEARQLLDSIDVNTHAGSRDRALIGLMVYQDRRHHVPRQRRTVTNWPGYDASLRQRGSLTVWFTEEAVDAWAAEPRTTR